MVTLRNFLSFSLLFAFCISSGVTAAQELTTNGDFETGDTSGWADFTNPPQTFDVTGDSFAGAFAGEIFNDVSGTPAVIKQANLGVGTVLTGQQINISFSAKGEGVAGGVAFAEFFSELDGGGTSKSEILGGGPLALTNTWQEFDFIAITGTDVSGGVTLQFNAVTAADNASTSRLFIDNVSVSIPVPEPGSLSVLILGSAGLSVRRRRSRNR